MKKKTNGQTVIEYFIIMVIILAVILSTGFIDRVRNSFQGYFSDAAARMR